MCVKHETYTHICETRDKNTHKTPHGAEMLAKHPQLAVEKRSEYIWGERGWYCINYYY